MQAFYKELDRIAEEFHKSGKDLEVSNNIAMAGYIIESDYNLTLDEAFLVFDFYKNDHPNYFWIYPGYGKTSNEHFALIVPAEYASAAERAKYEKLIFNSLNEYLALVKDEDSAFAVKNYSLCAFGRVNLAAGEEKTVTLKIEKREFTSVDEDGNRDVFAKNFTVFAGFSQPDARSEELTGNKCLKTSVTI